MSTSKDSQFRITQFSSVQFSRSVVSDSSWPHESQHARPPCPSPTPGVYPDPRPSSQWCHPAISSSVVPFSSCHYSMINMKHNFPLICMKLDLIWIRGEKVFLLRNLFYYQSNMTWLIQNANLVYVHNIRKKETKFNV